MVASRGGELLESSVDRQHHAPKTGGFPSVRRFPQGFQRQASLTPIVAAGEPGVSSISKTGPRCTSLSAQSYLGAAHRWWTTLADGVRIGRFLAPRRDRVSHRRRPC